MVYVLAFVVWVAVALAVAMFVGAGVRGPGQPRPMRRRYVPDDHGAAARRARPRDRAEVAPVTEPVLYVVDRDGSHLRPTRRHLVLPGR